MADTHKDDVIVVFTYTPSTGNIVTVSASDSLTGIVDTDTCAAALAKAATYNLRVVGFTSSAADTIEICLARS